MDLPVDILDLPGAIVDAAWNGIPFYMPDSREIVGRRVQRFFFPGQDATQYEDLGAFDGPMRISGLVVGDLYVSQARALRQALRTAGPGTLTHPWYGDMQMVLIAPAEIVFTQRDLRMFRFTATFAPYADPATQTLSSLDQLEDDITGALDSVQTYLGQLLGPASSVLWLAAGVESFANSVQAYWQTATNDLAGSPEVQQTSAALGAAMAPSVVALSGVGDTPSGSGYAAAVGALLAAVPLAVAGASATLETPAIGPGDAAAVATPIDGRVTLSVLLAANTAMQAQFSASGLTGGLALAQAALDVVAGVQAATTIAWNSNVEAQTALANMLAAIDATAAQAAIASAPTVSTTNAAVAASQLFSALQAARGDLVADMTATIGRLPQVQTVLAAAPLPAWLIANILAGDTPSLIQSTYSDLITRNSVRNPALVPAGAIETLAPASLAASLIPTPSAS
jgi:prophage DNA circulation protein